MAYQWVPTGPKRLPAVCDNCGEIFPAPIAMEGGSISISNVGVGPCPRCGGQGHIPDGLYTAVDQILALILEDLTAGPKNVRELKSLFEQAKDERIEMTELAAAIESKVPAFASLARLIPETRSEFYEFVTMILTALTFIYMVLSTHPQSPPTSDQVFNTVIEQSPLQAPSAKAPVPGRNDPCYCGSGKKYKRCHGE